MHTRMKITEFHADGSHYAFGAAIGKRFAVEIHAAFDDYALLRKLRAFHQTAVGKARYEAMLELHQAAYPGYFQELEGMAAGAERDFTDVFLLNLRGEYRGFLLEADDTRGCSDCSILTDELALIGHNEDGSPAFREHMYFVHARVDNSPEFTACCYPGFLPGNAFGFNSHGVCYSVDNIRPRDIRIGIGRHFLARSLLDAETIDDAIKRVTPDGRASAFSYTIGSVVERRIVQAEVMPRQAKVKPIHNVSYHANHVLEIAEADQTIDASSACRVARAEAILASCEVTRDTHILDILGDETGPDFPIYRSAKGLDTNETYCTALFDLDAREMRVYHGHPVREREKVSVFPI